MGPSLIYRRKVSLPKTLPISVIIPYFERPDLIERAIWSVLNQTAKPQELLVVDDGSRDGNLEALTARLSRVANIKWLRLAENRGVSHARNMGIQAAKGPWYAFLDSDDAWHTDKLACQWSLICEYPNASLVHCDEIWIRSGVRVNQMKKHEKGGGRLFARFTERCLISPSAVVIHKRVFDKIGFFDTTFTVCEDYDLWLRASRYFEVHFDDRKLVYKYGGHEDQLSRRYHSMDKYRIRSLLRVLQEGGLSPSDEAKARSVLIKKSRVIANGARKRGHVETADYYDSLALSGLEGNSFMSFES